MFLKLLPANGRPGAAPRGRGAARELHDARVPGAGAPAGVGHGLRRIGQVPGSPTLAATSLRPADETESKHRPALRPPSDPLLGGRGAPLVPRASGREPAADRAPTATQASRATCSRSSSAAPRRGRRAAATAMLADRGFERARGAVVAKESSRLRSAERGPRLCGWLHASVATEKKAATASMTKTANRILAMPAASAAVPPKPTGPRSGRSRRKRVV